MRFATESEASAAEEIAQNVGLEAWKSMTESPEEGGFDQSKGVFYSYIINRFAKFHVLQWRRRKARSVEILTGFEGGDGGRAFKLPDGRGLAPDERLEKEEELRLLVAGYAELFRILFLCGGYPHQQRAFGLSKHVFGRKSRRGIEGAPELV